MNAKEKEVARAITEAMLILPAEKREFIKGYAEGVIAMGGAIQHEEAQPRKHAG